MALIGAAVASTTLAQPRPRPLERAEPDGGQTAAPTEKAAILVVLDGARWQDVLVGVDGELGAQAGLDPRSANAPTMPRLLELARTRGAIVGAPGSRTVVHASGPNFVSMPGYSEILGGHPVGAWTTNADCPPARRETLVDVARASSESPREVAVFSSWGDLVKVATVRPDDVVVSAGRSFVRNDALLREDPAIADLLDRGARALAWPGEADYRPDRLTAPLALRYLELAHPRLMFVSLGDTDEHAHHGDYTSYLEALRADDDAIADLVAVLDRMGERGRQTTVYVTADHGRAQDFRDHGGRWPESARTWLLAIGPGARRLDTAGRSDWRLADVAPQVKGWMGLPGDDAEESAPSIAGR